MKSAKTNILLASALGGLAIASAPANAETVVTSNSAGTNDVPLPFSLGYVFTVSQTLNLTALGQFDILGDGVLSTAKVSLFNFDSGLKIAETTLSGSAIEETGFYDTYFVNIPTVVLSTGTNYLVATEVNANDFVYGSGIMTFDSAVDWLAGRATPVASPAMPATATTSTFTIERTTEPDGSYFGPNMKVSAVPEPTTAALLGLVGGGLLLRRRRTA